jgi:hypothetical protein
MPFVYMYVRADIEGSAYLYPVPVSQLTINSSALEKRRQNLVSNERLFPQNLTDLRPKYD